MVSIMESAFVCNTPFLRSRKILRTAVHSLSGPRCSSRASDLRRKAAYLQMAIGEGWPEARKKLSTLEPNKAKEPLPGIYFAEPPMLNVQDLLSIIRAETPDEWVNEIVRTFLGWRQLENGEWNDDLVEDRWKKVYSNGPPDFIGKAGDYTPEKDRPVKIAVQNLNKSVPPEGKQLLKPTLMPYGFSGWKVHQLNPNLTRRAQCVNFILHWYKCHYPDYVWS